MPGEPQRAQNAGDLEEQKGPGFGCQNTQPDKINRFQSPLYLACIVAKKGTDQDTLNKFGVFRKGFEMEEA